MSWGGVETRPEAAPAPHIGLQLPCWQLSYQDTGYMGLNRAPREPIQARPCAVFPASKGGPGPPSSCTSFLPRALSSPTPISGPGTALGPDPRFSCSLNNLGQAAGY